MKSRFILVLAGIASLGSAASAMQEQQPQQRPPASDPEDIRRLHDYSRCIVETRSQRVRELLAADFREDSYRQLADRLYRPEPVPAARLGDSGRNRRLRVQFNTRMFAGSLAEALLRTDIAGAALADRVAFDASRAPLAARSQEEMLSLCTVRAVPAQVAAIFATQPAGPEEAAAIRSVTPSLAGCIPAGATGEFNRPAIRSMLALAAYRLVQHNMTPRAAAASPASSESTR